MEETKNELVVPSFGGLPAIHINLSKTREAENRLIESKNVTPVSYSELEYVYNDAWRELRTNITNIQFQITRAEKKLDDVKADILLDQYPDFLNEYLGKNKKAVDNSELRKAFITKNEEYQKALDYLNQLKAMESFIDGKMKVMERACSYMKKKIDIILKSGLGNTNLYITSGKK